VIGRGPDVVNPGESLLGELLEIRTRQSRHKAGKSPVQPLTVKVSRDEKGELAAALHAWGAAHFLLLPQCQVAAMATTAARTRDKLTTWPTVKAGSHGRGIPVTPWRRNSTKKR
jgi:hypothetical protein